ncbi:MAG: imidazoleglycerol-phosphate dehydratase HisB [Lachnospiraceae bacterium]|jgi:imidazoleglycerol-phosphate dehydratase|nr:imidazoleglycerol-phosphate dehydratase HisB [Lachnospiraceae bacterium]
MNESSKEIIPGRIAEITRTTKETAIKITINLDGTGKTQISTGIGFFDHMLDGFARHGLFDLDVQVQGDLEVDQHHTVEDTGIVLGQCIRKAIGDKKGINRYGFFILPMDEVLALCALDLCDRPYFNWDTEFSVSKIGELDTELIREFFYAISYSAAMNLHLLLLEEGNNHHMAEALFKSFGKALMMAVGKEKRLNDSAWTTKGSL